MLSFFRNRIDLSQITATNRIFIMALAMISIMIYHQSWFDDGLFFNFFHKTGYWGVEVFLFLSGYGIYYSLKKYTLKQYYKRRFLRIYPACLFAGISQLLLNSMGFKGGGISCILVACGLFKWFIFAIIVYYAIAPLVLKMMDRYAILTFVLICFISFFSSYFNIFSNGNVVISILGKVIFRAPSFFMGMLFAKKMIKSLSILQFSICIISYFLSIVIVYFGIRIDGVKIDTLVVLPGIIFLSFVFNWLSNWLKRTKLTKNAILLFGKFSLEIYLWHEFIFRGMSNQAYIPNPVIQFALSILLSITFAYITNKSISKLVSICHIQ